MKRPTAEQYQNIIAADKLSNKHIRILETLYHFPNSSATARQLADALGYKGFQGASRQIGAIGKIINKETGVELTTYYSNGEDRPAFFKLVGDYTSESGWNMCLELQRALVNSGKVKSKVDVEVDEPLPTEFDAIKEQLLYEEGKVIEVLVNRYERNRQARKECLEYYGSNCQGCGFDFKTLYGEKADKCIQVHHKIPLFKIGKSYTVNPINDLIPLCANCHSIIHSENSVMTIEALKKLISKR